MSRCTALIVFGVIRSSTMISMYSGCYKCVPYPMSGVNHFQLLQTSIRVRRCIFVARLLQCLWCFSILSHFCVTVLHPTPSVLPGHKICFQEMSVSLNYVVLRFCSFALGLGLGLGLGYG